MRNSVILVDQIEQDIAGGLSEWDAVIESSVRRARPVILTAATAILAMIPLTRSVFWGPMAMAIMGGLSIATFLTLVNLPALYVIFFRVKPSLASATQAAESGAVHPPATHDDEPKGSSGPGKRPNQPAQLLVDSGMIGECWLGVSWGSTGFIRH